jgi:hypothetical protein
MICGRGDGDEPCSLDCDVPWRRGVHETGRAGCAGRKRRSLDWIPASFDRAVRPQDDLFRHVNGSWLAKTEIPADKASYGAFDILFDKAQPTFGPSSKKRPNRPPRPPVPKRKKSGTSTRAS